MMDRTQKLVIEIDPLRATMVLKQEILGVISRKEICPEDLFQAIIHATDRKTFVSSGLLPKGCFSVEICGSGAKRYCLLCQQRYADITYHNTLYERFPLPKLVFGFQISEQGKVSNCRLGVVADEELKCSTEKMCIRDRPQSEPEQVQTETAESQHEPEQTLPAKTQEAPARCV